MASGDKWEGTEDKDGNILLKKTGSGLGGIILLGTIYYLSQGIQFFVPILVICVISIAICIFTNSWKVRFITLLIGIGLIVGIINLGPIFLSYKSSKDIIEYRTTPDPPEQSRSVTMQTYPERETPSVSQNTKQSYRKLLCNVRTSGYLYRGEEQWFSILPPGTGYLFIETYGSIDTFLEAYDTYDFWIGENDDGGEGSNAKLELMVNSDETYYIKLRGYNYNVQGSYDIQATFSSTKTLYYHPVEKFTYKYVNVRYDDTLNIRSGPSPDTNIIDTIPPNMRIRVSDRDKHGDWVKVIYNGVEGYVNQYYLRDFE